MHPFNNKDVRCAVQHALNRKKLFSKFFSKHLPLDGLVPKGLIGGGRDIEIFPYSIGLSKSIIRKADMETTAVEFWIRTQDWNRAYIADIVNALGELGINIIVRHGDDELFYKKYFAREQQMFFITLGASYKDADSILSAFRSNSNDNDVGILDSNVDKGLDVLSRETNKQERSVQIRRIEEMLLEHASIVPMYQRVASTIHREYIDNVRLTPSWHEDIRISEYVKNHN